MLWEGAFEAKLGVSITTNNFYVNIYIYLWQGSCAFSG